MANLKRPKRRIASRNTEVGRRAGRLLLAAILFIGFGVMALAAAEVDTPSPMPETATPSPSQEETSPQSTVPKQVSSIPATPEAETPTPVPTILDEPLLVLERGFSPVEASPGEKVTLRVPLVINPDLPAEWAAILKNVTVTPLPDEADDWPLMSTELEPHRALPDLSRNARIEAIFSFSVKETAAEGSYSLPFAVSYTLWDGVGEDEEGSVIVYCEMLVTFSGTRVSVGSVSSQGILALDIEELELEKYDTPVGEAGDELTLRLPLINNGDSLTDVSIMPKVSSSLSAFPFVADDAALVETIEALQPGERTEVTFTFQVDERAESGFLPLQFTAVYRDGESLRESHYVLEVEIRGNQHGSDTLEKEEAVVAKNPNGGETSQRNRSQLQVISYVVEPTRPYAGDGFVLALVLQNEGEDEAINDIRISVSSIQAEQGVTTEVFSLENATPVSIEKMAPTEIRNQTLRLFCNERASTGVHVLSVTFDYQDDRGKEHQLIQPVTISVQQPVILKVGTPRFVEQEEQEGETGEMEIFVPLHNEGKVQASNVRILLQSEDWQITSDTTSFVLEPGEQRDVLLTLAAQKTGSLQGELTVEYDNAAGEPVQERVTLSHVVVEQTQEAAPREIDENGYWVLRDEEGEIIQRIDPQTGEPVKGRGVNIALLVSVLAVAVAAVSGLLYWRYRRKGTKSA